ncbi:MAG: ABC transporter permease subunit [Acidimicrobiaceae bacterium]|nr:ABC transporter permease subunit [Acidimicrobiaceae bacterium]
MLVSELSLLLRRRRTKVLLAMLFVAPWLMGFIIFQFGGGNGGHGPDFLTMATHNAVFLVLASVSSLLPLLFPLAVSLIASDSIAGEASLGTLRYLLITPVSRMKLLLYKLLTSLIFVVIACVGADISGLIAGVVFFPTGRVVLLSGQTTSFSHGVLLALLASILVAMSLVSVVGIGLAISTFTDIPVGAALGSLGMVILSEILSNITQVRGIWPLLPTNYWLSFADLFRNPIRLDVIGKDFINQGVWLVFGFSLAAARFLNKDITS